jgi:hypothetical protein
MLIQILGAIDFLSGLILIFGAGMKIPSLLLIVFGIILLIKSFVGLLKDFASWIDFIAGIIFILQALFSIPPILSVIAGILILQKGIFSFV